MRKFLIPLAALLALLLILPLPAPTSAQGGSASELIGAVNQLRAANGLPALQVNSALMSAAQGHSSYQASIGSITHTGAGGSRPRDRAAAAGYGGGATIFVSENIAGGTNLSVSAVISWWQGDAPHLSTMLGSSSQDVGAGVATADNFVYYTLVVGYVAGSAGSGSSSSPPSGSTNPGGGGAASGASPVIVSEVAANGSLTHEVQAGQTLIGIAEAYGVTVAEIQELNELGSNTFIYPGDKLLIKPPYTPTPTPTATATATPLRPTRRPPPTATPTPPAALAAAQIDSGAVAEEAPDPGIESLVGSLDMETDRGTLIMGILGVAFLLLIFPVIVGMIKKRS